MIGGVAVKVRMIGWFVTTTVTPCVAVVSGCTPVSV